MFHHCLHLRGEIFRSHLKLPITQIPTKINSNEKFRHALVNVTTILPIVISTEQTRIVEFILTLQPTSHTLTHITLNGMSCLTSVMFDFEVVANLFFQDGGLSTMYATRMSEQRFIL